MAQSRTKAQKPTSVDGLKNYLDAKTITYSEVEQIEGGTGNYVFRVRGGNESSRIYKHAEPYVASSNGAIPFPVDRMDFEATALRIVPTILPEYISVQVPTVMDYDKDAKVLVMSDAGNTTLKAAYSSPSLDVAESGRLLGECLATLHASTQETDIGEGGNRTARSIYRWSYSHLTTVAAQYGLDINFCEYIDNVYGQSLATDDQCVCHGDFWPGNVMLNGENLLTVVDWEMCRRGRGELDVAQFAAEAYLLDRFRGGKGLMNAFLQAYRRTLATIWGDITVDRRWARRLAVHMGVHLAFWPASVKWAEQDETKAVIELGHELMRRGDAEDLDWLRDNLLGALFEGDG
ncbi:MAG: hypothetical protein Q9166_002564 [cf. Caloplaca sp. 2 TL-2023]